MISNLIFSLNFMFLCLLSEELCTKEENNKTGCNFNFGHECIFKKMFKHEVLWQNVRIFTVLSIIAYNF